MLVESFWVVIAILSALIVYEFFRSKDGRLRVRIIWFFASLFWLYASPFLYYLLVYAGYFRDVSIDVIKIVLTFPMFVAMIFLYRFIKWGK